MKPKFALIAAALAAAAGLAQAQATQGVSKNEIVVGSIQDLSGPIAGFGKQVRLGMMLRAEELNEQGGVHGRKIKLLFEDSGYDPKKAVLAAQKLVNQDKIFAMVAHIGTATNAAAMPVQFEKNVVNFYPVTAAREMYEPLHKLKFAGGSSYFDQMRVTLPKLIKSLEVDIAMLQAALADPKLYTRDPAEFDRKSKILVTKQAEHEKAEEQWLELEIKRETMG